MSYRRRHMNNCSALYIDSERDIDPNGGFRIFKLGTKVRVPTGQIGKIVKINRSSLTVKLPKIRSIRSYRTCYLDIVE
jgi:dsDNA-specific endonuclease/ATPase MutS2